MVVLSVLISFFSAFVVYEWATSVFPWLRGKARAVAVILGLVCVTPMLLGRIVVHEHSRFAAGLLGIFSACLVTMGLVAVPIGLFRLAAWALSRARASPDSPLPEPGGRPGPLGRRQVIEGAAGLALFGAAGSMIGWGMVRGRHAFELSEIAVRIPGLPRVLDGYVIAQVSDIHIGQYVGDRELGEGLALVRRAAPDLIAVTGDMVDFEPELAGVLGRRLMDVAGRDGVVAVLGNHDYYAGSEQVLRGLRSTGVDTLVNRGRVVRPSDGGGFALLGVDDLRATQYGGPGPRLDRALATVSPALGRILLSHQPVTVDGWAGQVALQLSGHTHGGQINPARLANPLFEYVAGAYSVRGTLLYVNRGFGTVGPPSRVGAPPEVTRIVLVAA